MRILIFALAFLFCLNGKAQELPFLNWDKSKGLAQSQVRCLHQDHLGYIWVGTLGGVSKFNGESFENYSRQDGLLGNQINAITEMGDSVLVFGSIGGLTFFNGREFRTHRFPESLAESQVNDLYVSPAGALWVATEDGSIRWVEEGFSDINLEGNHIKKHLQMGDDLYCIAKGGVLILKEEPEVILTAKAVGGTLMDAAIAPSRNLLLATIGKGLALYNTSTQNLRYYDSQNGLIGQNTTGITPGSENTFWAKSRDGFSQIVFEGNEVSQINAYGPNQGLVNSDVRALLSDEENNLWLGTNGDGLSKFVNRQVAHYSSTSGIGGDIPMAMAQDNKGGFWIGTYDNGISLIQDDSLVVYGLENGLRSSRVWSMAMDADGRLWAGTSGGLSVFEEGSWKTYTKSDGLSHNQVLSILLDGDQLILGTAKGVMNFDPVTETFTQEGAIGSSKVRAIQRYEDALWFATNSGVYRRKNGKFTQWLESDGLPDNSAYCVFPIDDAQAWVGTESGLCKVGMMKVESHPLEGGFGANHINFIGQDRNGYLWLGTNDGVFVSGSTEEPSFNRWGEHEGITHLETNQNAFFADDENVWLGTSEALTRVDLDEVQRENSVPNLQTCITNIRINLENADWEGMGYDNLKYGAWPQGMEIPFDQNHLTFYFDAPVFKDADRIQFQYKLEGLTDQWESLTESKMANYSELPFNDFVFKVRAVTPDGVEGEVNAFAFTINPPFWLSWWFVLIEVLVVVGIVYLIYRARRRAFLEKVEKERLEYKSRLLSLEQQTLNSSMNRHFIFNALNSIQYYINRQDKLAANRYLSNFAKLIRKNLDSSQVNFTSLREEIERLELYLKLEHMRFKDKFNYSISIDEDVDQEAIKVPAMLLQPFLENSIWHGILPMEEEGNIDVHIAMSATDEVRFCITDDGIGIETSRKNKSESGGHISQGMSITSGRIELLRRMTRKNVRLEGPYEWKDDEGNVAGTRVELMLPIDFQDFYAN